MALFQKGKSGNPGGRTADTDETRAAKDAIRKLAPRAAELLAEMLESKKFIERKWAIDVVLSYSISKPTQEVELSGKDGSDIIPVINIKLKNA